MPAGARDQIIGGGTPTDLPGTIGTLPMYSIGGLNAHITDSVFSQADSGNWIVIGSGALIGAAQTAGTGAVAIGKGAKAWGDGFVAIGTNANAGAAVKNDGCIVIGGASSTGKNQIRIGSQLAFGGAFADNISIGTQTSAAGQNGISIGTGGVAAGNSAVGIGDTTIASESWSVAIGYHAACTNSGNGTGSKCIAIGYQASAVVTSPGDRAATAIGRDAVCSGSNGIAIGTGASVSPSATLDSIAIGHGATATASNQCVIGDTTNGPINKFRVRTAAATPVHFFVGASGAFTVRDLADTADLFTVDSDSGAGNIRMLVYDVTAAAMKRVSLGAADSGGVGFKYLRVPN